MSRPLRILVIGYLPPPYFGPSVTFQALLRSEFTRRFDVTFLNQSVVQRVSDLERVGIGKLWLLARLLAATLRHLVRRRFDYCLLSVSTNRNAFLKEWALIQLARCFGVPAVLYAHARGIADFHDRSPAWLQRRIASTARNAAGAIVMGEALRDDFARWVSPDRLFVVGSGIVPSRLPPRLHPPGEFHVLFLGNLIAEKGVFTLLESIPTIVARWPQTRFFFAGDWKDSRDKTRAEEFIARQGIADKVTFVGVVWGERKAQLLADADLLAFPTYYPLEAHPLVLLEALEAGLPVVTTARAAIPEIIRDGENGFLVREQDPTDLAEKIGQLIEQPHVCQQMRIANQARFATHYSHQHYGDRMIKVFEALANQRS